jgi:hypothetical protein
MMENTHSRRLSTNDRKLESDNKIVVAVGSAMMSMIDPTQEAQTCVIAIQYVYMTLGVLLQNKAVLCGCISAFAF